MTGRFVDGRDQARIPGADIRTERSARVKSRRQNLGDGLTYDSYGRLATSADLLARIAALESGVKRIPKFTVAPDGAVSIQKSFVSGSSSEPGVTVTGGSGTAGGSKKAVRKSTAATVYLTATDSVLLCDATSTAMTVYLPLASQSNGRSYYIKKIDSSGNAVTVDGNGSETIDGATTFSTTTQYVSVEVVCDGIAWYII